MSNTSDNIPQDYSFRSKGELFSHFDDHRDEFAVEDMYEYEQKARVFLHKPVDGINILECIRQDGKIQRFDKRTNEFAILVGMIIVTYYKPAPQVIVDAGGPFNTKRVRAWGLAYFHKWCQT